MAPLAEWPERLQRAHVLHPAMLGRLLPGRLRLTRVQARLEQPPQLVPREHVARAHRPRLQTHDLHGRFPAPIEADVALGLSQRSEPRNAGTVTAGPDGAGYGSAVSSPRARRFEYIAGVDRAGGISADRGAAVALPAGFTPEHLVLAGLGRCTLASLTHHARRAGVDVPGEARTWGAITKRAEAERYAFVEIDCALEVELEPRPGRDELAALLAKAERDCFVGASVRVAPRYRWRINGEEIE